MVVKSRAMAYSSYGEPSEKLNAVAHQVGDPTDGELLLKLVAAPINPADMNQIRGTYPARPEMTTTSLGTKDPVAVGGNEGCFQVVATGPDVERFKVGDWALPKVGNFGTWRTHVVAAESQFNLLRDHGLTPTQAATISINPCTAYQLLHGFADLHPGDYFIQNGANSVVGKLAIQIGHAMGFKSINVVRDRDDWDTVVEELTQFGADMVVKAEELSTTSRVADDSQKVKLALNCVGGEAGLKLAHQLDPGGHFVSYGVQSGEPITLSPADVIFRDIHAHGYWLSGWAKHHPEERYNLVLKIIDLMKKSHIKDVSVSTHTWRSNGSDEELEDVFKRALNASSRGKQIIVFDSQ